MAKQEYRPAPAVEKIGRELIKTVHQRLKDVEVRFVFKEKAAKSGGAEVWGKARKISGLNAYLATDDPGEVYEEEGLDFFVIEIAESIWSVLDEDQRTALVDHELCHCTTDYDDEGTLTMSVRGHDVEEFTEIIERHGLWRPAVKDFAAAATQGKLEFDGDD